MKYYLFLLICLSGWITSCSKDNDKIEAEAYLRIPEKVKLLQYQQNAQTVNIQIETNSKDWTIQSNRDWCEADRITSNQQMFRLKLTENDEVNVREAKLTLKAEGISDTITVQQLGSAAAILLNPDKLSDLASAGTEIGLIVTTNINKEDYELVIPDTARDWLHIDVPVKSKAMVDYQYIVRVDNNPATRSRSSVITVQYKNEDNDPSVSLPVSQKGRSTDAGDVEVEGDIKVMPTSGKDNQHHGGQGIENTFDGKIGNGSTPYHSPWSTDNPSTVFPVTLEYFFDGEQDIDYIIYHPNEGNGNFGKLKLYTATADNDTYVEAGSYDFQESSSVRKITFATPLAKATKIKFEITSGAGGFASCSEMEFYRKNEESGINKQLLSVFKDITCCELREDVTDEAIDALPGFFANLAICLRDNTLTDWEKNFRIRDYEAYSDVEEWSEKLMTKRYSNLDNITGIYAEAGEELIVLVGNTHGHSISIQCIGENVNSEGAAQTATSGETFFLEEGVNKIRVSKTGMLFIMYTADPSADPIRIHIPVGGGHVSGFFDLKEHKTDEKYSELLSKADYKYFGVRGEKIMFYFHTSKMKEFVPNEILSAIHLWDNIIGWEQELMGIEDVRPAQVNNHMFAISPESGYMWASDYQIGFVYTYLGNILLYDNVMAAEDNAWGPAHEIGHVHQEAINWVGSTESSNNLFSNYVLYKLGKYPSRGSGLCKVADSRYAGQKAWWNFGEKKDPNIEEDTDIHMRMNWQLWNYFHRCDVKKDFWQQLFKELRKNPVAESDPGRKQMLFAKLAAQVANQDLTDFFDMWGFFMPVDNVTVTQYTTVKYNVTQQMIDEVKAYMSTLPKPKHAFQYIEDRKKEEIVSNEIGDVGYFEQFKLNKKITKTITYTLSGRTAKITDGDEAVAFEWRKDNRVIYFGNSFEFEVPSNISVDGAKLYAVQADGERIEVTKAE